MQNNPHVTIYHNPRCSNSRKALEIIRSRNIEPVIVEYLATPLARDALAALLARMGVGADALVRWKEAGAVAAAGIARDSGDGALLDAMAAFPILMNRPVVVTDKGAKLCRPGELVEALL